ncbi:MAG TPA: biotin-dependent carboxyltransferase family protein [Nocardioidaceae bacterium]|nr:biotin-dependent carboxyltransferase family protein [Nocardioidaceae bacterium]
MKPTLEVLRPGPYTLIQDRGRPGLAEIGVGPSGAADRAAYELANRLVGNAGGVAALELTLGGLEVTATGSDLWVALTGAAAPMYIDGRLVGAYSVELVRDGARLAVGVPQRGLRSYLAVRGGIDVPAVLGSRSFDSMAQIGPPPLRDGDTLVIGSEVADDPVVDQAPPPPVHEETVLRVVRGPRDSHIVDADRLVGTTWTVSQQSDRIGIRLEGPPLSPADHSAAHLPSEGAWRGAVQVPPSGQPTILLADRPVTGGYPVVAVIVDADTDRAAQVRPGESVRFVWWDPSAPNRPTR